MKQVKAKIIFNRKVAPERYKMRLEAPSMARAAGPGRFLMAQCDAGRATFLRRPFAFHSIGKRGFDILYQVVGPGTEALSRRKRGEKLDVIGPLGNGFTYYAEQAASSGTVPSGRAPDRQGQSPSTAYNVILVAGGIAVAPLYALAESLPRGVAKHSTAIIGGSTASHILCVKDLKKLGFTVKVATEDGSRGHKGLATDLLGPVLRTPDPGPRTAYACGPRAMLKKTAELAAQSGVPCEVSLEEKMGCGTGACRGCAVKTTLGQKMVCQDGPIFKAGDILW